MVIKLDSVLTSHDKQELSSLPQWKRRLLRARPTNSGVRLTLIVSPDPTRQIDEKRIFALKREFQKEACLQREDD
jgi:hypothetical protein